MENIHHEVNIAGEVVEVKLDVKDVTCDSETTGLPPKMILSEGREAHYEVDYLLFPRIVTIAWKINDEDTREFIINQQGFVIPEESIAIHGITNEMANESSFTLASVLRLFIDDCVGNSSLIGHNIYFDTSIIKANFLRLIIDVELTEEEYEILQDILHKDKRIDTMRKTISFCNLPKRKWPKLTELYLILFSETFNAHSAKDDVDATRKCYLECKKRNIF